MELGSLADWFAAVGTVGAFIGAIFIYLQDRTNKKQELARALSAWYVERLQVSQGSDVKKERHVLTVGVYNAGAKPVVGLNVRVHYESGLAVTLTLKDREDFIRVSPEESVNFENIRDGADDVVMVVVRYHDGNGVPWQQNLALRTLTRQDGRSNPFALMHRVWRLNRMRHEQGLKPIKFPIKSFFRSAKEQRAVRRSRQME